MRKEIVDMRRKTYIINNIAVGRTVVSMQIGFAPVAVHGRSVRWMVG